MPIQSISFSWLFSSPQPEEKPPQLEPAVPLKQQEETDEIVAQAISLGWQPCFDVTAETYLNKLIKSVEFLKIMNLIDDNCCFYFEKKRFQIFAELDPIQTLKTIQDRGLLEFIQPCAIAMYSDFLVIYLKTQEHILTIMQMFIDVNPDTILLDEVSKSFLSASLASSFKENIYLTEWLMKLELDFNAKDFVTDQQTLIEAMKSEFWLFISWLLDKNVALKEALDWAKQNNGEKFIEFIDEELKTKILKEVHFAIPQEQPQELTLKDSQVDYEIE